MWSCFGGRKTFVYYTCCKVISSFVTNICDSFAMTGTGNNAAANNHNYATPPSGNFKRQNTVDSATIKENTARISAANNAAGINSTRPVSATVKTANTPSSLDTGMQIYTKSFIGPLTILD